MGAFISVMALRAWSKLSVWLALVGAIMTGLVIAFLQGRSAGKAAFEARKMQDRLRSLKTSAEVRHDVQNNSDADLDRRLDRWMRD